MFLLDAPLKFASLTFSERSPGFSNARQTSKPLPDVRNNPFLVGERQNLPYHLLPRLRERRVQPCAVCLVDCEMCKSPCVTPSIDLHAKGRLFHHRQQLQSLDFLN